MKLAILAQSYLYDKTSTINGTLVQLHNLAYGFVKNNVEVHYICITKDNTKLDYEFKNGIHFYWIKSNKGLFEWKRVMPIYSQILNRLNPDAVYVRGRNAMQYVAGKYSEKNRVPYIWGTNGEDSAELWKNIRRLKVAKKSFIRKILLFPLKAMEDFYINKGMKMASQIVNQTEQQRVSTLRSLNKQGIVLSNYFDISDREKSKKVKENLILWLANLSKAKQPELFVEIVGKVDAKNWNVLLAGGSNDRVYKNEMQILAKKQGIDSIGTVKFKDSSKFYQRAKIYINTSKPFADGLPNAYIQSWLNGTIVLSLHHNPNNWMETQNIGYCSNGDLNKLVLKLQELIESPDMLSQMSANAKTFAKQQFSDHSIIESYIKLFQQYA